MVVKGSVSMAESVRKTHLHLQKKKQNKDYLMDSDMAAAAQQLMQLSDEENNNNNNSNNSGRNYNKVDNNGDEEVDQRVVKEENGNYVITSSGGDNNSSNSNIMEEIFGKEEALGIPAADKKRRYRSLADIYLETKPVVYHLYGTAKKLRS